MNSYVVKQHMKGVSTLGLRCPKSLTHWCGQVSNAIASFPITTSISNQSSEKPVGKSRGTKEHTSKKYPEVTGYSSFKEKTLSQKICDWKHELEEEKIFQMATRNKSDQTLCEFFDFYALNLLDYFAGSRTLNHAARAERITNKYEELTEKIYRKMHRALLYSVVREFRHLCEETYNNDEDANPIIDRETYQMYWRISKHVKDCYDSRKGGQAFLDFLNGEVEHLPIQPRLEDLLFCYNNVEWCDKYGGKNWGKATALLLNIPKTLSQKQVWIDRVLDLQHNTGHILNKTDFYILSAAKQCHRADQSVRKKRSPLNYRRYANTMSDLLRYSSHKVRKLAIANMNYIPERIR